MKRELDSLLEDLRTAAVPAGLLDDVEKGVWQRIAARDVLAQSPQLRLSFQVISVAAAFLVGILLGVDVAESAPTTQSFLVEEMNLLPPGPGGMLL
jgi:hypothetical protein